MTYGFIEITGITAAVTALDIMLKTADTRLVTWERKWGGRLVTIIIEGEVAAVKEAIEAAKQNGISQPAACGILPNPHPEITRLINKKSPTPTKSAKPIKPSKAKKDTKTKEDKEVDKEAKDVDNEMNNERQSK
jgi:microcompartment protein CcmL/EutN